jgi:TolA-binding protein
MRPSTTQKALVLPLLALLCRLFIGCGGSRIATASDDTFFEPLKSLDRPPASKPSGGAYVPAASSWAVRADSLLRRMREQQQRLDAIETHLQLLEVSRQEGAAGASRGAGNELPARPRVPSQREQTVMHAYGEARRLYNARRYQDAIAAFEELLRRGVQEDLQDNCSLWIGASYFHLRQFDSAVVSLQQVVEWNGSNKRADAYFLLGQTYEQLGNVEQARSMFEALLKEFPASKRAGSAREKLKVMKPMN